MIDFQIISLFIENLSPKFQWMEYENNQSYSREQVKPEQAMEILKGKGIIITKEQAIKILEFMNAFAKIVIKQHLDK